VLYLGLGQPGLFGERLFVILKDQADVSDAAQTKDYQQRRAAVYHTLVEKADSSQTQIRKTLDTWRIPYQSYYLENAIEVQGGPLVRWWLLSRPEVGRVLESPILRPLPEPIPQSRGGSSAPDSTPWNLQMIGADRVWNELGVTGKGVIVGQSDSGVDGMHTELADSYHGQNGKNDYNWYDPWFHTQAPTDIGGHGTHTLATVLGNQVGIAPDAQWIGCVNLARNLGNLGFYLDCMQFMLAPFPQNGDPLHDGRPDLGAQVLNNSWGCPPVEGCDPTALLDAVSALRAAGIFVVASAGNDGEGGCETVRDPIALYAQVFTVGAVDKDGLLASFSSTGPVEADGSGRTKPDIAAPGVNVLSAYPGGTYDTASGTSMAGPHIVGVVALMWSGNPSLIGDIDQTQKILYETASAYQGLLPACVKPGRPNDGVGYGVVNAYEAVRRAMGK
jgi:subtilisin family serine protease